jgi:hypothetical protein
MNKNTIPKPGEIWEHYNGVNYEVVLITNLLSNNPNYPVEVVYRTCKIPNHLWSRPLDDWHRSMSLVKGTKL